MRGIELTKAHSISKEDQVRLSEPPSNINKFHALVVRVGEKLLLSKALQQLQATKVRSPKKRKAEDGPSNRASKKR